MKTILFESPKDVTLEVNDQLRLDLPEVAGTGYKWDWVNLSDFLVIEGEEFKPFSDAQGSGARISITIKARAKGSGIISLKYWQPWSGDASIEKRFEIRVNVV